MNEPIIDHVSYILQISHDGGTWWGKYYPYPFADLTRANNEKAAAEVNHPDRVFRVVRVRETWTVVE